jgi:hypothetical protein
MSVVLKPASMLRLARPAAVALAGLAAAGAVAAGAGATRRGPARTACDPGYVQAQLSWGVRCLRVGEFCKVGNIEYHAYGFDCPPSGLLTAYGTAARGAAPPVPAAGSAALPAVGAAVLLAPRTSTGGCRRGPLPDRRCSPGAYSAGLTTAVICSPGFRTATIRNVPQSEKFQVEAEYGLRPAYYGFTIEIDHIVPLELGGSNDSANLFPEPGSGAANYHVKDALENALHDLVCSGAIGLRAAQRAIAANWEALYRRVFGVPPTG